MIATGLTFLFGFCLALLLALLLSPIVWRRSRRMARREFEATIPTSANEIRASYDHVRAAAAIQTRTREMDAAAAVERAAHERANAGRMSIENAGLRERNAALITLLSDHKAAFEDIAETLESREADFDRLEAELHEVGHDLDLRSEELDALAWKFRVLVDRAERGGVDTGFDADDLGDDSVGDRPSRVEMQKSMNRLNAEIDTLRTGLRQEQSTVRERDATILDLLAAAATGTAMAANRAPPTHPALAAPTPSASDNATNSAVPVAEKSGDAEMETAAPDSGDPAISHAGAPTLAHTEAASEDVVDDASNGTAALPSPQPAPSPSPAEQAVAEHTASPPARSLSSLFAGRIREALKRPGGRSQASANGRQATANPIPTGTGTAPSADAPTDTAAAGTTGPEQATGDRVPLAARKPANSGGAKRPAASEPIAVRLREALQLPDHPLGTDDVDDETLRLRIVDLAARVIDQAAKLEGQASPIEAILTADRSFSSMSRPRERQTLTDRVRVLRSESEAAE